MPRSEYEELAARVAAHRAPATVTGKINMPGGQPVVRPPAVQVPEVAPVAWERRGSLGSENFTSVTPTEVKLQQAQTLLTSLEAKKAAGMATVARMEVEAEQRSQGRGRQAMRHSDRREIDEVLRGIDEKYKAKIAALEAEIARLAAIRAQEEGELLKARPVRSVLTEPDIPRFNNFARNAETE